MSRRTQKQNLRRARALRAAHEHERDTVARVVARLEGKPHRIFVLTPSHNQFYRWLEENPALADRPIGEIRNARELAGVRWHDTDLVVELAGWDNDPELRDQVRLVKAISRRL